MRLNWLKKMLGMSKKAADMVMHTDEMRQQLLYEYWLKRDTWQLRDEAVPLLLGLDPTNADLSDPDVLELWTSVEKAVEEGNISVYNRQAPVETWSVTPAVIYRWAGGNGLSVPAPFSELMEFILQTVKQDEVGRPDDEEGISFNVENENILGAALAVVSGFSEDCIKINNGGIDIRQTIILMNEHSRELFGREELGYTYERVYDLLKAWAGKIK